MTRWCNTPPKGAFADLLRSWRQENRTCYDCGEPLEHTAHVCRWCRALPQPDWGTVRQAVRNVSRWHSFGLTQPTALELVEELQRLGAAVVVDGNVYLLTDKYSAIIEKAPCLPPIHNVVWRGL